MSLKPKTVRRLLVVSLLGVLLVGGAFSLFVVRHWQNQRLLDEHREQGLAAFEEGDYFNALEKTAFYFRRGRADDPDVLYALAESRRKLEEPDRKHLVLSIRPYQLYLDLRPEDDQTRRTLLETYNQAGYFIEARDLAASMRPEKLEEAGPEHLNVLREEAFALAGARAYGERLERVMGKIFEIEPLDVDTHLLKLDVMSQRDERAEARAWGLTALEAHAEDPRALVVYAASLMIHPTTEEIGKARIALCEAAGLDPQTAQRLEEVPFEDERAVRRLVALLDSVRAYQHSFRVLRDAAGQFDDVQLRRSLVRRLWQEGSDEEILKLTESENPASGDSDAELLAMRAQSLLRLNRAREAEPIIAALGKRQGDYRAQGWTEVFPLLRSPETPPLESIKKLREAVRIHPHEPVFHVMLGDAMAALERNDEARRAWRDAGEHPVGKTWALPWLKLAESLLPEGRADEAVAAANEALLISPGRVLVNVVWFEAQSARISGGSAVGPTPAEVLSRLEHALAQLGGLADGDVEQELRDRLLPCKVVLLARMGRIEEARKLALGALEGESPSSQLLQRLAVVSASERLGLEGEAMARAQSLEGGRAQVAQSRAMQLAREGKIEEGLELLRGAAGASPSLDAELVIARYLDATNHGSALGAFSRLAESHPQSIGVQHAVLTARAPAADRDLVRRTIARYQHLQGKDEGEEDSVVRMARARMLLHGRPTKRDRDEAVGILAAVVTAQPSLAEARTLLAAALSINDAGRGIEADLARATAQLTEAVRLEPRNAQVALELARLLQLQREHSAARDHLVRIASDQRFDPLSRRRAAEMLLVSGEAARARDVLLQLARAAGEDAPGQLLVSLAEALRQSGRPDQAQAVYQRLVEGRADDAESLVAAALYLAQRNELDEARTLLGRLEEMPIADWERTAALASFEAASGDAAAAESQFERAVAQAPQQASLWRQYASMHMRSGDWQRAVTIAGRGLDAVPGDASLSIMLEQSKLLASGDAAPSLTPLIEALRLDASSGQSAGILRAIEDAKQRGELDTREGLERLAARYPGSPGLQMYVARRLAPMDGAAAAALAHKAMSIDRSDAAPAKLAAEMFLTLGRWNDMLSAAMEWRTRDRSGSAEPDLAIAEAQFRLGRTDRGLATLSSHIDRAVKTPADPLSLSVLNLQAMMLVASGRERAAQELLRPLLPESAALRIAVWIGIAARDISSLERSRAWLDEVRAHIRGDAADEHLAAAIALSMLADRFPQQGSVLLEEAKERLTELVGVSELATAGVWEALGVVRQRTGDLEGAEEAYMRAIELDERRAVALNNLANILAQTRGDLETALMYSERAVRAATPPDAAHLATLAAIRREIGDHSGRRGDAAGAKQSYRESARAYARLAELRPGDPAPIIQLAQSLWLADDARGAAEQYERTLNMPGLPRDLEPVIRNNLATALRVGGGGRDDQDRAREVILVAIRMAPQSAFYDTLGWIEIERDDPAAAAEAFRRAIELAGEEGKEVPSARLGLAYILRGGSDQERAEAARLVADLGDVGREFETQLDEVKASLSAGGGR